MKQFNLFKTFLLVCALVLLSLMVFSVQAATADNGDGEQAGCTGDWVFPTLYVGGKDNVVYASATYEFDENCNPVLVNETRLNYLPQWLIQPDQEPVEIKTVPISPPAPPKESLSPTAVNTCHIKTFEEDVVGLDMIAVQNDQTYSWNGTTITLSSGSVSAIRYFSWWYTSSGPSGSSGYHSSSVAWAKGNATFYCNGGPFCGGGPMYYITLRNDITMDASGGCGGYGTYSGTIVPGGRVQYSVWRT